MAVYMATQFFLSIIQVDTPQIVKTDDFIKLLKQFIIFLYDIISCRVSMTSIAIMIVLKRSPIRLLPTWTEWRTGTVKTIACAT